MRPRSLLMIIHLHMYYSASAGPRGRRQGQSLVTWNFITCLQINRKAALLSLVWVYGGSVPSQTLMRMMTKVMMRMVTYKEACACACALSKFAFFGVCTGVRVYITVAESAYDIYKTLLDSPIPPYTPTPPPTPSSSPFYVNENARLYLERADVTSGLSDEPITVGVGLCDSLPNPGLLHWQTGIYWLTQHKVSTLSLCLFLQDQCLSLVNGMLQEMDSGFSLCNNSVLVGLIRIFS